jgi:hypothetical protein
LIKLKVGDIVDVIEYDKSGKISELTNLEITDTNYLNCTFNRAKTQCLNYGKCPEISYWLKDRANSTIHKLCLYRETPGDRFVTKRTFRLRQKIIINKMTEIN